MASKQLKHMNELYASIKERVSKPNLDLGNELGHRGELAFGRHVDTTSVASATCPMRSRMR